MLSATQGVCLCLLLVVWATLSGCAPPWCANDPCPNPDEKRDFFCGCYEPGSEEDGHHATPSRLTAACICGQDQEPVDTAIAYFYSQPRNYNTGFGERLHLQAFDCKPYVDICPIVGARDRRVLMRGAIDIEVERWTRTVLINGARWYSVEGRVLPTQRVSIDSDRFDYLTALAPLVAQDGVAIAIDDALNCELECDSDDPSPLCETAPVPPDHEDALQWLIREAARPNTIRISDLELRQMFAQTESDCSRSDTTFSDGKLTNEGDRCYVSTVLPQLDVPVEIAIPPIIQGDVTRREGGIHVAFTDGSTSPNLTLGDEDLDSGFGGAVQAVDATRTRIHFGTQSGCIAVTF